MFARASQWIQYFDNHTAIPAPFNLLPSAYCINQAYKIGMSLWEKVANFCHKYISAQVFLRVSNDYSKRFIIGIVPNI